METELQEYLTPQGLGSELTTGKNLPATLGPGALAARPAREWASQQWSTVELGDQRLNRRVVEIAARMAAHPEASLPSQMQSRAALCGAYRVLNHPHVTMAALLAPAIRQTLEAARSAPLVLLVEDTTELDYTAYPSKQGLGPLGNGKGRGLLLHSTLAIEPEQRQILGLAHAQAVLRQPTPEHYSSGRTGSPEGQLWEESAASVGSPPAGSKWVHVSDAGSDIFEYMLACLDRGKHFLLRAHFNRRLSATAATTPPVPEAERLLDYAETLTAAPHSQYTVSVPARGSSSARQAHVVLAWAEVQIRPPKNGAPGLRRRGPLKAWVVRVWEPEPPAGAEAIAWVLLSSLPITNLAEAQRATRWYSCRWLAEDYHQCLKTGCRVEHTQLDAGADIQRLLGFAAPIAVRLLQLRQTARQTPELPARAVVEPLMVEVLARLQQLNAQRLTVAQFWQGVSRLGGHQGRRRDGPPGWQTLWKGWRLLADLTEGARLFANSS